MLMIDNPLIHHACINDLSRAFFPVYRYLIIHLKRFRFSPSLEVEKLHDPVVLQPFRELMVTTSQVKQPHTWDTQRGNMWTVFVYL